MDIGDEIFYIANMIEDDRERWMKGNMSDAFFSEHLRNKVEKLKALRKEIIKSGK